MSNERMSAAEPTRVITLIADVRSVAQLMVVQLIARLHDAGYTDITAAQHVVFENLDPGGTRLTTLAQRTGMTRQSMTELVIALQRNGYLQLKPDPSDSRARLVHLTRKGKALVRVAIDEITAIEARWQESAERGGLNMNLRQLLHDLAAQHDPLLRPPST